MIPEDYPERKLLNFLTLVGNILNSKQSWNIDALCHQVKKLDFDIEDYAESTSDNDSVLLSYAEVKSILLADVKLKSNLEVFLKILLKFLFDKIKNFNRDGYQYTLYFVNELCTFLKACEKSGIVTAPIKSHVTKFLSDLVCILETANAINFTEKGFVYQFITKIAGSFRKIKFANTFLIIEVSKKLQTFYNVMQKLQSKKNFDISYYEVMLLYLRILKEILQYNLEELLLTPPSRPNKHEDKALKNIIENLNNVIFMVPDYVAVVANDCLNLLL